MGSAHFLRGLIFCTKQSQFILILFFSRKYGVILSLRSMAKCTNRLNASLERRQEKKKKKKKVPCADCMCHTYAPTDFPTPISHTSSPHYSNTSFPSECAGPAQSPSPMTRHQTIYSAQRAGNLAQHPRRRWWGQKDGGDGIGRSAQMGVVADISVCTGVRGAESVNMAEGRKKKPRRGGRW